jgi:hypothetical protein
MVVQRRKPVVPVRYRGKQSVARLTPVRVSACFQHLADGPAAELCFALRCIAYFRGRPRAKPDTWATVVASSAAAALNDRLPSARPNSRCHSGRCRPAIRAPGTSKQFLGLGSSARSGRDNNQGEFRGIGARVKSRLTNECRTAIVVSAGFAYRRAEL